MNKAIGMITLSLLFGCGEDTIGDLNLGQGPTYTGQLADQISLLPIQNATVSLGGIEADEATDAEGNFVIGYFDDTETCQTLTVNAPGYEAFSAEIDVTADELVACADNANGIKRIDGPNRVGISANLNGKKIELLQLAPPATLMTATPSQNSQWTQPAECAAPGVNITGVAQLNDSDAILHDVVILIDTSGSTGETTAFDIKGNSDPETILQLETFAAHELATVLKHSGARVGIAKFARFTEKSAADGEVSEGDQLTAQTRIVADLTTKFGPINSALNTVEQEGAEGATDAARGIEMAVEALVNAGTREINGIEITPQKSIVLITDGIPTLPIEPGETQEAGDRHATIAAAVAANEANIRIYPIVIEPTGDEEDRLLTTMPAVQAASGTPGAITRVTLETIDQLPELMAQIPLSGVTQVNIENTATGVTTPLTVAADGTFSGNIGVATGTNAITLSAHSGIADNEIESDLAIQIHAAGSAVDINTLISSNQPVSALTELSTPDGVVIIGNYLLETLQRLTPNAYGLAGMETFIPTSDIVLTVQHDTADYNSDIGYFLYDPNDPPSNSVIAGMLMAFSSDNIIYSNTGLQNDVVDVSFTIDIPDGNTQAIAFFIIPNGDLSQAQADTHPYPLLYTLPHLNPGSFLQHLNFYNSDTTEIVYSWEDIAQTFNFVDRDFSDMIFSVSNLSVTPATTLCLDE